jgi:hypothetical protein
VCPILLRRLCFLSGQPQWNNDLQIEQYETQFSDPFFEKYTPLPAEGFQKAAKLVLFYDAVYIVLCPGSKEGVKRMAEEAGSLWKNTPFVADSGDLPIVVGLDGRQNMRLGRGQAIPAIIEYDGVNQIVDFGRG